MLLASAFGAAWIEALAGEIAKCLSFRDTVLLVSIQILKFCNLVISQLWPIKMLQACLLDLPNLITDKPSALHVATQLRQRVRRDRLALKRSQIVKAPGGPSQFGIESADA